MGIKRKIVSVALCLIMMLSCINVNVINAKAGTNGTVYPSRTGYYYFKLDDSLYRVDLSIGTTQTNTHYWVSQTLTLISGTGGATIDSGTWTFSDGYDISNPDIYSPGDREYRLFSVIHYSKPGYHVSEVTGNGVQSSVSSYTDDSVTLRISTNDCGITNWYDDKGTWYHNTLGLKFAITDYSITYNLDGGEVNSATSYNLNSDTFKLTNPTKDGYTFVGWTGSNGTTPQMDVSINKGSTGNKSYTANWTINKYKNRYDHWAWGFTNSEGNNGTKNAFKLQTTYGEETYGQEFTPDATYGLTVPNGFYLAPRFGNGQITGEWTTFNFGTKLTQPSYVMNFEYDYYPTDYTITYNLNGGTNNSSNPSTYNVLYGVTFGTPTKKGYDFVGWYDSNGNKITGINEGCNATFSDTADLYSKLKTRTTGDISVTAKWQIHDYSITTKETGSGVISNDSKITYSKNTSVFIIPAEGYTTSSLKIDGVIINPVTKYNFLNVEKDHTVEATFTITQNKKMELIQKGYSWIDLKL